MSRVSFKYMFDDIFYSIDIKNNSIMVYTVFLKKYLQICIKDLDSSSYLFTKPYTEGHIGIPFIEYMKNNILKTTTSSYLTFNNIISSIFLKNKRIEASHYRAIPTNDGILSQGEFSNI
ncbi:hypothetical protein Bealeia1_00184 [Candidatus Bealeia paramacronuclearis]|uniref:Uncharacterized protein n=1 Tax=Candidatus Bealeia paramacronuclearis TaxID=1921001 RepID=A0ABZ2C4Y5_9PROT